MSSDCILNDGESEYYFIAKNEVLSSDCILNDGESESDTLM